MFYSTLTYKQTFEMLFLKQQQFSLQFQYRMFENSSKADSLGIKQIQFLWKSKC